MSFSVDEYAWPAYLGRRPFEHQRYTVRFVLQHKRCFVLNDMGTGKTLSALWALDILFAASKIRRALVISPLSTMRSVWAKEISMNVPHLRYAIAHGSRQQRIDAIRNPVNKIIIINHDGIKSVEDEIVRDAPDVIVIDEVTAFKSNSDRTKCMLRIAKGVRGVWAMTGDLTPNSPLEAFYPIKIVNPSSRWFQLTPYFGQFRDACMVQVNEIYWVPKPEAPQIVLMCAQPAVRFTRDQCLDLPETTTQELEVPMSAEQVKFYDVMKKQAFLATDSGEITAVNAAVVLNKLLQISAGAVKNDAGDVVEIGCKERLDALFELYEETPQHKLVVFATYRATIAMLEREFAKRGVRCAAIHGDVAHNLRASHIERFQSGDLQVLVLQPQSSAHGITLTASSTIVWFSLIASNELFTQGNARIVRVGQERKTFVYMFVGSKAERHIAGILQRKGEMSRETLELFKTRDL